MAAQVPRAHRAPRERLGGSSALFAEPTDLPWLSYILSKVVKTLKILWKGTFILVWGRHAELGRVALAVAGSTLA